MTEPSPAAGTENRINAPLGGPRSPQENLAGRTEHVGAAGETASISGSAALGASKGEGASKSGADSKGVKNAKTRFSEVLKGLEQNYILIFLGGALLALSLLTWGNNDHFGSSHVNLSVMFLIIGVVSIAGGALTSFLPDSDVAEVPKSTKTHIVLDRAYWASTMQELENLRRIVRSVRPTNKVETASKREVAVLETQPKNDQLAVGAEIQAAKAEFKEPSSGGLEPEPVKVVVPELKSPILAPAGSTKRVVEREAAAFRAAYATGIPRIAGETAKHYLDRANALIASGLAVPDSSAVAAAASSSLMESQQRLTKRQISDLAQELDEETKRWSEETMVPRKPGEELPDYAVRVRKVLEFGAKT